MRIIKKKTHLDVHVDVIIQNFEIIPDTNEVLIKTPFKEMWYMYLTVCFGAF